MDVLKATPGVLQAQIDAAKMYQDWGGMGKEHIARYVDAIVGKEPDAAKNGKFIIWGWGEIAKVTAGNPQYKDQFHEARYNLAYCRYHYALAQTEAAKKELELKRSKNDIALTAGLYPDLGGEERKKQYDQLLRQIQKSLGEKPDGLKALQTPATAAARSSEKTSPVSATAPAKK